MEHSYIDTPQINNMEELIQEIYRVFESDEVDVEYMMNLLNSYKSCKKDWIKFAKFDRFKYTRNLIDEGNGKFNLMLLCWGPSLSSSIHDHHDAHCFMKVLEGGLQEVRYDWPNEDEPMVEKSRGDLKMNGVCYINDSLGLHRVENPSHSEPAVSLHLYCPPFQSCKTFDERTGTAMKCPVTFYSKFGEKVKHVKSKHQTSSEAMAISSS